MLGIFNTDECRKQLANEGKDLCTKLFDSLMVLSNFSSFYSATKNKPHTFSVSFRAYTAERMARETAKKDTVNTRKTADYTAVSNRSESTRPCMRRSKLLLLVLQANISNFLAQHAHRALIFIVVLAAAGGVVVGIPFGQLSSKHGLSKEPEFKLLIAVSITQLLDLTTSKIGSL